MNMSKEDLALSYLRELISHKSKLNQIQTVF